MQLLADRDTRVLDRIPVTSPARTILDLAAVLPPHLLERVVAEAQARRLVREGDLVDQLHRHPCRPGTPALRNLIELERGPALTRSEAERRLLRLVRAAGFRSPGTNVRVGPYEVDFLWRAERIVVEIDGFRFHSSRAAFERDRERDTRLIAAGYAVLRFTWRQLVSSPEAVVARLAAALTLKSS